MCFCFAADFIAESLHLEVSDESARANLELPVNVGPIRSVETMIAAAIVRLLAYASFFINKIRILFLLMSALT
jgi:hypothetical protein